MFQGRRRSATVLAVLAMLATPVAAALGPSTVARAAGAASTPGLATWGSTLTRAGGWQHSTPLWTVPGEDLPAVGTGVTSRSTNWSGYIAAGSRFTSVAGQWKVPTVRPAAGQEASATWIGIDGVTDRSLIQTGTAQDTSSAGTSYFAWAEVLPYAPQDLGPVSPGDEMRASIVNSSGTWTISISDETEDVGASGQVAYDGEASSAEWVEEAPTSSLTGQVLPLADFGSVRFTDVAYGASAPG
ncbi:MAG: G1 family glutamic endopeptidase, partial [Acidimicrobiales bacterium]